MRSAREDTVGAVKAYRRGLRTSGADIRFPLVLFAAHDHAMDRRKVHVGRRIAGVPDLAEADYAPRGATPLIDAACTTIRAVEASPEGREAKSVFVIQTDGPENASRDHDWDDLRALNRRKEAEGWEFVFLGCGIDACEQGGRMGLSEGRTMSCRRADRETHAAFRLRTGHTIAAARDPGRQIVFSAARNQRAGDDFAARRRGRGDGA